MQRIEVYQSLWAMELRQPGRTELSVADKVAKAADAGFAGLCLDLGMDDVPETKAAQPLLAARGMTPLFNGFPKTEAEFRYILDLSKDFGAPYLSLIAQVMPRRTEDMIDLCARWMEIADQVGQTVLFETHRHGLLNDLYPTLDLLDALPDLKLNADLSHFVVDREFALPLSEQARAQMSQILRRSHAFQGRIASNEQVQIEIGFPQHAKWVEQFKAWWAEGFRHWRATAPKEAVLTFLCELGPPPYAITGADGVELSDRWEEALIIRGWAQDLFAASA